MSLLFQKKKISHGPSPLYPLLWAFKLARVNPVKLVSLVKWRLTNYCDDDDDDDESTSAGWPAHSDQRLKQTRPVCQQSCLSW